ncbi:MAG: NADH-quinone oxidoreductase subunit I [Leptonema sp. (in: bacteria)]
MNFLLNFGRQLEIKNNLLIPSYLKFKIPFLKKNLNIIGEFPRRVEQYEILCKYNEFCILSPMSGIAQKIEREDSIEFNIKISGKNTIFSILEKKKEAKFQEIKDIEEFKKFLNSNSLFSFEYQDTLSNLFFKKRKVIFSLYDFYIPHFWNKVFNVYKNELMALSEWFSKTFKDYKIEYLPNIQNSKFPYSHKSYNEYHYKYLYNQQKEENFYVFSPATLFALIRAFYYNEPFVKNVLYFRDYSSNQESIFFLYHGTVLQEVFFSYPYLHNLSLGNRIKVNEENYFNIFYDYYYYYKKENQKMNFCSGCFICNHFCPVNANPMSLLENPKYFKKEICILCGLCEELCESNLPLLEKIRNEVSI